MKQILKIKFLAFFVSILFLSSCITNRNLEYINTDNVKVESTTYDYIIQKEDLLSVQISSTTKSEYDFFNLQETSNPQLMNQNPYLYGYLVKFDLNLIDASSDLGAKPYKTFLKVILPLSIPGIVAGSMLVFIPVVGEFVIPELLGGSDKLYFGKIIWDEFFVNRDWPIASALAMSGILILVIPIIVFQLVFAKFNFKDE